MVPIPQAVNLDQIGTEKDQVMHLIILPPAMSANFPKSWKMLLERKHPA